MQRELLLALESVSVQYGGVRALDEVSIALDEGEIVAVMGPNGAGKSTVLKAFFGLAPIASGEVRFEGSAFTPVPHEVVARGIAFVPQGRRVFAALTIDENLEVGVFMVRDKKIIKERKERLFELFPMLKDKRHARSGSLSGGQQQMLAIARGLMTDPKVLLLDEPSLGLSPKVVKEVFELVRKINEERRTAIMVVEHNIRSLLSIAHRAYVLDKGRVIEKDKTPAELSKEGELARIALGAH